MATIKLKVKQPDEPYARIDGSAYRHIYAVGDVHGCKAKLLKQLEEIEFDREQDLLIGVGDLIDRGPDSVGMLGMLDEPWFRTVRGNHEDLASAACEQIHEDAVALWLHNGGTWILKCEVGEIRNNVMRQLEATTQLPFVIEVNVDGELYVIAHACYPYSEYKYGQPIDGFKVTWDRDRYLMRKCGEFFHTKGAKLFIHGHNHTDEVETYGNHVYIATGAYGDKPLTLYKIK